MKRLSDYSGEQAIEITGRLLEAFGDIIADKEIMEQMQGQNTMKVCGRILKKYPKEAYSIIQIVDDEKITAGNVFPRFMAVFSDLINNEDFVDFFGTVVTTE